MQGTLNKQYVEADTLRAVEDAWKKAVEEYKERSSAKRKVILYKFEANAQVDEYDDDKGELKRVVFRREDLHFHTGVGLVIDYDVCYETKTREGGYITYVDEDGRYLDSARSDRLSDHKVMSWTQEREDFFRDFVNSLKAAIVRAAVFMEAESELAARFIEEKGKIPMPLPEIVRGYGERMKNIPALEDKRQEA